VWTCTIFYILWFAGLISYIYKSATSSHFKPGLLKWRLWLGFFLTSQASFMKIITWRDSRTRAPQYSRIPQVPGLLNFASFQSPWNIQQIRELKPIRLLFPHIIRRSAKCIRFVGISSWMFPFHETELFIPRLIREYTYEFSKSDVSRVKGFCPIPQHRQTTTLTIRRRR
jgi:hypothetical protein